MSIEGLEIPLIGAAVVSSLALAERGARGVAQFLADQRGRKAAEIARIAHERGHNFRRAEADRVLKVWQVIHGIPVEGNGLKDVT